MKNKYFLLILLIIQIIGLKIVTQFPVFIEHNYSNGVYYYISSFSRSVLKDLPFSVGDILYVLLVFFLIYRLIKARKVDWKQNLLSVISVCSIFYFFFHLLWGLNYYRLPLSEKMRLKTTNTTNQLVEFTQKLIKKTNTIHVLITKDSTKKVVNYDTEAIIFKKSMVGYHKIGQLHPFFSYKIPSQKKSLFSYPLTYMGFSGYLNPFTNEAQINNTIIKYQLPATICHEMAHQLGYASESECNFIGFLSATQNPDLYFKYSGYTHALQYCLSNIKEKNPRLALQLIGTINSGILINYAQSKLFWKQHQTVVATFFDFFYDSFLKINQQKEGVNSYSKFTDLLVSYYTKKEL